MNPAPTQFNARPTPATSKNPSRVTDKYQPVSIKELGLKWGDLRFIITELQRIIEILGYVVRNAGFAWEMFDEYLKSASERFWSLGGSSR